MTSTTSDSFSASLLRGLPTAVVVTDAHGVIVCWNEQAERLYGHSASDVLGAPVSGLRIGPVDDAVARTVTQAVLTEGAWAGEYDARRADGSRIRISATFAAIADVDPEFTGFVGVSAPVSERASLDERLAYEALHDPLTGLPNRRQIGRAHV